MLLLMDEKVAGGALPVLTARAENIYVLGRQNVGLGLFNGANKVGTLPVRILIMNLESKEGQGKPRISISDKPRDFESSRHCTIQVHGSCPMNLHRLSSIIPSVAFRLYVTTALSMANWPCILPTVVRAIVEFGLRAGQGDYSKAAR